MAAKMRNCFRSMIGVLLLLASVSTPLAAVISGPARVVDGDTIEIDGIRIRINGIDAPEAGQKCGASGKAWRCGDEATDAMARLVEGKNVECETHSKDGYGRTIATCFVDQNDLGGLLVKQGFAWAFVKYTDVYAELEARARVSGIGIWQGDAVPAWEYRAARWQEAEQLAPNGCPIKGNISKNGKIYHPPWSPWYNRTKINIAKGERWFCDEAEAIAAGWRAPYWK